MVPVMRVTRRTGVWLAAAAVVLSGCVGTITRNEFDAEVRARGGGLTDDFVADSLQALAEVAGAADVDDVQVLDVSIDPPSRYLAARVRSVARPDFVDVVTVRAGVFESATPVQNADEMALDDLTFRLGSVAFDELESMTTVALGRLAESDGYLETINIWLRDGRPEIVLRLSSARRTLDVVFDADGVFQEER